MARFWFICLLFAACQQVPTPEKLQGAWQVDSTHNYYNGFQYRAYEGSDWATYLYRPEGEVLEMRGKFFRQYRYQVQEDGQLLYFGPGGEILNDYEILKLTTKQLILKKEKNPIFGGTSQERYEIRFFSRIDSAGLTAGLEQQLEHYR